ncbi:MAG: catalase family protein [Xylophilus ampelinus]
MVGVEGPRVAGSEGDTTQDFLMINGPAFSAGSTKGFLRNLKLLEKTTDRAPGAKEVLSTVMQGVNKALEAVGIESATVKTLGGHPETHPLGETYFTQVPLLYGPYMAKFSLAPVSSSLQLLKDAPIETEDRPDALRDAVTAFFGGQYAGDAEWELRVQLCTDVEKMPIEQPDKEWPQDESPYIAVARLRIPRQPAWDPERVRAIDEGMSFNPWHALAAHRPLGAVMRARRAVYPLSVQFRSSHGRCPVMEPRAEEAAAAAPQP